jgi:hypothetical protein
MALDDNLHARAAEYDSAIDTLLDALHGSEDTFAVLGLELIEATTRYARALNDASRESPQEIAEHYLQLARNLHIEAPFLIAKLTRYRERHVPAHGTE